ncbi:MAG: hypothetical protein IPL74_08890 [Bacteroidetes bacterium]|nr:hypothetical protein [Bacteroidota bacterium]
MTQELLYSTPQWLIGFITLVILIVSVEMGYLIGLKVKVEMTPPMKTQISTIQTAILTFSLFFWDLPLLWLSPDSIIESRWL